MEIEFKKIFKLVDNGNLTYNLHSLCYQNNILISEFDLGNIEDILVKLKKQKEVIDKATKDIQKIIDSVNNNIIIGLKQFNFKLEVIQDELNGSNDILEDKEV